MDEAAEKRLQRRIAKMVEEHPDEVLAALLDHPFWPQGVDQADQYVRFGDDDNSLLRVLFSHDGDAWPNVYMVEQEGDARDHSATPRYRVPFFGGGESAHTRQALLILARAIAMDNESRPQRRQR